MVDFSTVKEFEKKIAEFFGAPYSAATDSCTHAIELCLRYVKAKGIACPQRTYLSIPMLSSKLNISLNWRNEEWKEYYHIGNNIIDAATMWRKNSFIEGSFTCISFQYQKHLSLGRGGMILCDHEDQALELKKMSYDGRLPGIPWREQDIDTMGFHYYMVPETAKLGLQKLPEAIKTEPRQWSYIDYPLLTDMSVFKNI